MISLAILGNAAGRGITDRGLIGKIDVTGLGLPSEMAEYIEIGSCPYIFLWNPSDGGTEVLLGAPFKFDPSNIGEWKTVY